MRLRELPVSLPGGDLPPILLQYVPLPALLLQALRRLCGGAVQLRAALRRVGRLRLRCDQLRPRRLQSGRLRPEWRRFVRPGSLWPVLRHGSVR
jgi:hypothetical protein